MSRQFYVKLCRGVPRNLARVTCILLCLYQEKTIDCWDISFRTTRTHYIMASQEKICKRCILKLVKVNSELTFFLNSVTQCEVNISNESVKLPPIIERRMPFTICRLQVFVFYVTSPESPFIARLKK